MLRKNIPLLVLDSETHGTDEIQNSMQIKSEIDEASGIKVEGDFYVQNAEGYMIGPFDVDSSGHQNDLLSIKEEDDPHLEQVLPFHFLEGGVHDQMISQTDVSYGYHCGELKQSKRSKVTKGKVASTESRVTDTSQKHESGIIGNTLQENDGPEVNENETDLERFMKSEMEEENVHVERENNQPSTNSRNERLEGKNRPCIKSRQSSRKQKSKKIVTNEAKDMKMEVDIKEKCESSHVNNQCIKDLKAKIYELERKIEEERLKGGESAVVLDCDLKSGKKNIQQEDTDVKRKDSQSSKSPVNENFEKKNGCDVNPTPLLSKQRTSKRRRKQRKRDDFYYDERGVDELDLAIEDQNPRKRHRKTKGLKKASAKPDLRVRPKAEKVEKPKPFLCEYCPKSFSQFYYLKLHKMHHTNERPHKCDICNKGFRMKWRVKLHRRTHMDMKSRPFICGICKLRSNRRDNLRSHLRKMHKIFPAMCNSYITEVRIKS